MMKIGFIGAGTTGTALAVRLSQGGCPVISVSSRSLHSAQKLAELVANCQVCQTAQGVADTAELVFITTPDDVIAKWVRFSGMKDRMSSTAVALIPLIF